MSTAKSPWQSRTRYMNTKSLYEQGFDRRIFEGVHESFGVLPLQLPSARHSCIVTFIRHGAYKALAELTAFSTRSMRSAADNCALDGLQSNKNLLAGG